MPRKRLTTILVFLCGAALSFWLNTQITKAQLSPDELLAALLDGERAPVASRIQPAIDGLLATSADPSASNYRTLLPAVRK
jgi:hypothetical protein